jgi:hypothetical protein
VEPERCTLELLDNALLSSTSLLPPNQAWNPNEKPLLRSHTAWIECPSYYLPLYSVTSQITICSRVSEQLSTQAAPPINRRKTAQIRNDPASEVFALQASAQSAVVSVAPLHRSSILTPSRTRFDLAVERRSWTLRQLTCPKPSLRRLTVCAQKLRSRELWQKSEEMRGKPCRTFQNRRD